MDKYYWTQADTDICERAEASGLALNKHTGKFITISEMKELGKEYDEVRHIIDVDEFMEKHIKMIPFEDKYKYD